MNMNKIKDRFNKGKTFKGPPPDGRDNPLWSTPTTTYSPYDTPPVRSPPAVSNLGFHHAEDLSGSRENRTAGYPEVSPLSRPIPPTTLAHRHPNAQHSYPVGVPTPPEARAAPTLVIPPDPRAQTPTAGYKTPQQSLQILQTQEKDEDELSAEFSAIFGVGGGGTPGIRASAPTGFTSSIAGIKGGVTATPPPSLSVSPTPLMTQPQSYSSGGAPEVRPPPSEISSRKSSSRSRSPSRSPSGSRSGSMNIGTPGGDPLVWVVKQYQQEKVAHDSLKKKLDHQSEQKALSMKEVSTLKYQLENLEMENESLNKTVEQSNHTKTKSEITKILSEYEQEKKKWSKELEMEKNLHVELTIENSQLKASLDGILKSNSTINNEVVVLRSQVEKESSTHALAETENRQFREHWPEWIQQLESEKSTRAALVWEIQELKKQIKQHEQTLAAFEDLTSKKEILEVRIREEQSRRLEAERNFLEISQKFNQLDQKRQNFEDLRNFSQNLVQTAPSFTVKVNEILEIFSEPGIFPEKDELQEALVDFQENTQKELQKQSELLNSVMKLIGQDIPKEVIAPKEDEEKE